MWSTLGFDQKVFIGVAIALALAGPIVATIMLWTRSWQSRGRVFLLYTLIFACTAMFSFGWGIRALPRELWLQRVLEIASIGMLVLALTLTSRVVRYVIPQPSSQSNPSEGNS
jgi:hypothetical protein